MAGLQLDGTVTCVEIEISKSHIIEYVMYKGGCTVARREQECLQRDVPGVAKIARSEAGNHRAWRRLGPRPHEISLV